MKKVKTSLQKKVPEKFSTLPLVPAWVLMPLWLISLGLPNLIYSGINFADTLHILKWAVTGVPVAIAVFIAGVRLLRYGWERITLKLDMFALLWGVLCLPAHMGTYLFTDRLCARNGLLRVCVGILRSNCRVIPRLGTPTCALGCKH